MSDGVIVFGPAGCGKSYNAEALRQHFGLRQIDHEWTGRERLFPGTLVLTTTDLGSLHYQGFRVVSFDEAMREAGLPNHYRPGRKWLPIEWLDEVPAKSGPTPEAFLQRGDDGVLRLFPLDYPAEEWPTPEPIQPDQVVTFTWHEDRGRRIATVNVDRTWSLDEPFPSDTNCFEDAHGFMEVEGDLDSLVKGFCDDLADTEFPKQVPVDGWTWSDGTKFRVRVLESGAAQFEEVEE